ncbi:MAG: hypothetical protein L3J17_06640 [Candidatus Jettenia sp.]|nr:MAG: hypothetical protein L3J17_06640 [Candidatus Jettenia sp.]
MPKLLLHISAGILSILFFGGCMGTPRVTDPKETAVEQLLLSTAADRALMGISLKKLEGKKVFVEERSLEGADDVYLKYKEVFLETHGFEHAEKAYVIGLVSILLGKHGAFIVEDKKEAEVIAAITTGALSIDRADSFVGVPSFTLPIPLAGNLGTPEIAFYKAIKQSGIAKFAINIYDKFTGEQLLAVGPISGFAYLNFRKVFFFFSFHTTDIPEKKKWWYTQP